MFKLISSIIDIILGLALSIGPWTLFKVCGTAEKVMRCHYSAQAVTVIGVMLIIFGLIRLLFENRKKLSSSLNSIVAYAAAIAVPAFVIGGCANSAMHCQKVAFPCIYAICAVGIIVQVFCFIKARKDD